MTTLICDCNRSMPLDGAKLGAALGLPGGAADVHSTLCRREAGHFQRAARGAGDVLVACTQESRLFAELAAQTEGAPGIAERPIRFVNIRENGGWSKDAARATPKIAALIAAAQLPPPEPVQTVSYRSTGRVLVLGADARALSAAAMLADSLDVSVLMTAPGAALPQDRAFAVHSGTLTRLTGWLGAFEAEWSQANPIDLDLCTRCNACIDVCPEQAIDFSYQVDPTRCTAHRSCVRVCEAAGAIDFERAPMLTTEAFDLVLDLGAEPAFAQHQPPQGYHRPGGDAGLLAALLELKASVGVFEKPKFFNYKQKICAHSRNEQIGCTACIDVCSARAIRSDASLKGRTAGAGIVVDPHLCVGCGACTTVCPSGALTYAAPRPHELGARIRTLLATYRSAGGTAQSGAPALLIHSPQAGARLVGELGRAARTDADVHGLGARVLPLEVWHTASVGIDLWLAALAYGASQVWVLMSDEEAPDYRAAVAEQMVIAETIVQGLGYTGEHFRIVDAGGPVEPAPQREAGPARRLDGARPAARTPARLARLDAALRAANAATVARPATFAVQADKRATLDLAVDHLMQSAPAVPVEIGLPARGRSASPFGSIVVDTAACTLCLACVGACPEAALADNAERPQLRFIEKNCVQCGLCASTCPEDAITLAPRLWLADGGRARQLPRVLNEVEPFRCIRCTRPFATAKVIEVMLGKLAGHAMFQGRAAERLQMCGDCRVIDMHTDRHEVRITDL